MVDVRSLAKKRERTKKRILRGGKERGGDRVRSLALTETQKNWRGVDNCCAIRLCVTFGRLFGRIAYALQVRVRKRFIRATSD